MNVCMLVANPILYDGRVIRHARALVEAGHKVTVLGVIGPNDADGELPEETPFAVKRLRRDRAEREQRRRLALLEVVGATVELGARRFELPRGAQATSAVELAAMAVAQPFDVYHGNDLNTLPAVAWAASLRARPYLYDAHEFYVEESPNLSEFERRARRLTEERLARRAAAVLTVNDLLADELATRYHIPRPVVIRNLPPRFATTDPQLLPIGEVGTLRLLYHGTHIGLAQPGTDDVLRAMAQLRAELAIHWTLRGQLSAQQQTQLWQRVAELGLTGRVAIAPPVPGPTALMAAAVAEKAEVGLAFHPPLAGNFRLATSSKVYEYQMAGLAVCATDVAGNHVILDESAGAFYPFGDDQALAQILRRLATDRQRLRTLRHNARTRAVAEFGWETEKERLLTVYQQLARRT